MTTFSDQLLAWFDEHGRKDLPWQQNPTPYHVWLSEIMLQQTQVSTVIPYYQRFIKRYPDVTSLANAPVDDVLAVWTGLGYYARARNLHKAAAIIVNDFNAELPADLNNLIALPGIGRSTAGAIMALAHNKTASILDGNVKRVLARYFQVEGWPGIKTVENKLWQLAEELLPSDRISHYIQAQMDLGATLCTRTKPRCEACPLKDSCQAFLHDFPQNYPYPKPKKTIPSRQTHWLIFQSTDGKILLQQRPSSGIWGGLWSFPEVDSHSKISDICENKLNLNITEIHTQPDFNHTFTHFKLSITPHLICCSISVNKISEYDGMNWYKISEALLLGLPAPVKSFLQSLQ
jgi:A/G-specific adenine glycosylase